MFDDIRVQYDIDETPVDFAFDPEHPNRKRSCAGRLAQLRRQFGITDKDLEVITKPTEVKLPVIYERMSKEVRKHIKEEDKAKKRRKYELVDWYVSKYASSIVRERIFEEFGDLEVKQFVTEVYREALDALNMLNAMNGPDIPEDEIVDWLWEESNLLDPVYDFDILDDEEESFKKYCKKHPIHNASDIIPRRLKFKKWRRKTHKKYYSMKRMRMYDPLFKSQYIDKKAMAKNLRRISEENELRTKKFYDMMKKLVDDKAVGVEAMAKFKEQTTEMNKRIRKRYNRLLKENDLKFPSKVQFDVYEDGHNTSYLYDDWDSKKALDSVLKIPCSDL